MYFKLKTYLRYLLKSTNQHGVHSPFVYTLVTKCFYDKKHKSLYPAIKSIYKKNYINANISFKNLKLIDRLITYLNYKQIAILENTSPLPYQTLLLNDSLSISKDISKSNYDFIYMNIKEYNNHSLEVILSNIHNDSLLLINGIHLSLQNITTWEQIKNHPKVTVTIDIFDLGFVFFRREQAKEHFVIRA